LIRAPQKTDVSVCKRCGSYLNGNRWQVPSVTGATSSEAAKAAVYQALRLAKLTSEGLQFTRVGEAKGVELRLEVKPAAREALVEIHARGKIHELQTEPSVDRALVTIELKQTTCDVCSLISAGYYEAILQVRGEERLPKGEITWIRKMLEARAGEVSASDRSIFISKIEERPEGLDFYVSSLSLARGMAEVLKKGFNAEISETAKLIGRERGGRRKFRVSVLARLPAGIKER